MESSQGWDLRTLEDGVRLDVMKGWMVTGVFAGVIMPTLVAAGGFSGGCLGLGAWGGCFRLEHLRIRACVYGVVHVGVRNDGLRGGVLGVIESSHRLRGIYLCIISACSLFGLTSNLGTLSCTLIFALNPVCLQLSSMPGSCPGWCSMPG